MKKWLKKKKHSKSNRSNRKGMVCVWAVIFLLLLLATTGLALDMGKAVVIAQQLQNAADSAALAGARIVKIDQAQAAQKAIDTAIQNYVDGQGVQLAGSDIVPGRYNFTTGIFTPTDTGVNALKVTARRTDSSPDGPINLLFGSLFNVDTYNISRSAIALASGGTGAGLIALAPGGIGLDLTGNAVLNVNNGTVLVNSDAGNAVRMNGNTEIIALELAVTGDVYLTGNAQLDPDMTINLGVSPSPDPLCPNPLSDCLPEPAWDPADDLAPSPGETVRISGNATAILEPGYYSGGLQLSSNSKVTLKPGIYILDGVGINISGNANVCAKGVMLYIIGDGKVDITGNSNIELTPIQSDNDDFCNPSYSYPLNTDFTYEGIGIFQARNNNNEAEIAGNGSLNLEGTLYFPANHIKITGNGGGVGNQLIANTIEISGNGTITIMYDGRNPTPANRAYLVK